MTEISKPFQLARTTETIGTPYDYGAIGDGVTDDTAAINEAELALEAGDIGILVYDNVTYLVSSSVNLKSGFHVFNDTVIKADASGAFTEVLLPGAETYTFGATNTGAGSGISTVLDVNDCADGVLSGKLIVNCNKIANTCGLACSWNPTYGSSAKLYAESLEINNAEKGIYGQDDGVTITGASMGVLQFRNCNTAMDGTGNSFDDVFLHVLRIQEGEVDMQTAGVANFALDSVRGFTIGSFYLGGNVSSATRLGIDLASGVGLVIDHLYMEKKFTRSFELGANNTVVINDLKSALSLESSDNNAAIDMTATSGYLEVVCNSRYTGSSLLSSLINISCSSATAYKRTVRLKTSLDDTKPLISFSGGNPSKDDVEVDMRGGKFRHYYDGANTTERIDRRTASEILTITTNVTVDFCGNKTDGYESWNTLYLNNTSGSGKQLILSEPPEECLGQIIHLYNSGADNVAIVDDSYSTSYFRGSTGSNRSLSAANDGYMQLTAIDDGTRRFWQEGHTQSVT